MTLPEWYALHQCDHAHCPEGCEHPQPVLDGEELICGKHWVILKIRLPMTPCASEDQCAER